MSNITADESNLRDLQLADHEKLHGVNQSHGVNLSLPRHAPQPQQTVKVPVVLQVCSPVTPLHIDSQSQEILQDILTLGLSPSGATQASSHRTKTAAARRKHRITGSGRREHHASCWSGRHAAPGNKCTSERIR